MPAPNFCRHRRHSRFTSTTISLVFIRYLDHHTTTTAAGSRRPCAYSGPANGPPSMYRYDWRQHRRPNCLGSGTVPQWHLPPPGINILHNDYRQAIIAAVSKLSTPPVGRRWAFCRGSGKMASRSSTHAVRSFTRFLRQTKAPISSASTVSSADIPRIATLLHSIAQHTS